jgi:hypothetical protein
MKLQRTIDKKLLASFIEYATEGKVTVTEWHRFIVTHYHDPILEKARIECVRLLIYESPVSTETKQKLYKIASELRNSE